MDDKELRLIRSRDRLNQDLQELQFRQKAKEAEDKLRDQFAMQALNALIISRNSGLMRPHNYTAEEAYEIADYMMKARKNKNG